MIKWTSKGKEGDPIPWPFKPFCSIRQCGKNTEYVEDPELGFRGAITYCDIHKPKLKNNYDLSREISNKETTNILKVKSGEIKESELLDKSYIN
tara:strand:+ start:228 stop:509 length:282 start_codon:yes stop_codon:yes gene_type:complete